MRVWGRRGILVDITADRACPEVDPGDNGMTGLLQLPNRRFVMENTAV